jgi:hypothetical protein
MPVPAVQAFTALTCNGVGIGKGVYGTVQEHPLLHAFGIVPVIPAPNAVGHEVPERYLGIVKGQINMGEKVHCRKNRQIKELIGMNQVLGSIFAKPNSHLHDVD